MEVVDENICCQNGTLTTTPYMFIGIGWCEDHDPLQTRRPQLRTILTARLGIICMQDVDPTFRSKFTILCDRRSLQCNLNRIVTLVTIQKSLIDLIDPFPESFRLSRTFYILADKIVLLIINAPPCTCFGNCVISSVELSISLI